MHPACLAARKIIMKAPNYITRTIPAGSLTTVLAAALALCLGVSGCGEKIEDPKPSENVAIFYIAGYNSLYSYLRDDVYDLCTSTLPTDANGEDVVLVYSRIAPSSNFKDGTPSALFRLYRSRKKASDGTYPIVRDTLLRFDALHRACSSETITEVLNYAKANFPSKRYGMLFSSHGRGWVPNGYYVDPKPPVSFAPSLRQSSSGPALPDGAHVYVEPDYEEGDIVTKSIGEDIGYVGSTKVSYEMEIEDFASAIPYKLDYLLVDACLMGGVEFAYALRGKVGIVGFSQAEVLADGFDYKKVVSQLCTGAEPLPLDVCKDYYSLYNSQSGPHHSATISAVDCDKISSLASVCKTLFEKYRSEIASLDVDSVQGYSGGNKKWFFDLEDVLLKAGISDSEKAQLSAALEDCVPYKGCTGQYYTVTEKKALEVKHFCGLSMFMPSAGNEYLDGYYKALQWNEATGLIR